MEAKFRTWWKITVDGVAYETSTLRLSELEEAEDITGIPWLDLNPLNVRALQGLLYAFLRRSMTAEDAKASLAGLTASDVTVELVARPTE